MSSTKRSRSIVGLAVGLGLAALVAGAPGIARAGWGIDAKMYPGAFCQQGGTSQALWYYHGRVINTSTSRRIADCPVVTDSGLALRGGKVEVFVVDRHYSEDLSCTVHAYNHTVSTPTYVWSNRRSSGSSESVQSLVYDFSNTNMPRGFAPILIGCEIPGVYSGNRSELVSYHVAEGENDFIDSDD